MTQKEQQTIDQLLELAKSLQKQNQDFQQSVRNEMSSLQEQLSKKEMPVSLEKIIFNSVEKIFKEVVEKSLTGYGSPLTKLIENVLAKYDGEIKNMIDYSFKNGLDGTLNYLNDSSVKESISESLAQNIVRSIFSAEKSQFDKITQEMKADATFRAKLTLAVDKLLTEYKNEKST